MINLSAENLLHSNLFNFVVMIAIFALIATKLKVKDAIEANRKKVEDTVHTAIATKEQSYTELKNVELAVKDTVTEIEAIVELAKTTLQTIESKIVIDTEKQVKNIENNVQKVINSEVSKMNSTLTKGVSNASVALAESNMLKMLNENKELHNKFINDSIDELDRVEI